MTDGNVLDLFLKPLKEIREIFEASQMFSPRKVDELDFSKLFKL